MLSEVAVAERLAEATAADCTEPIEIRTLFIDLKVASWICQLEKVW